ncbi:MAG: hypothetical protein K2Z81_02765, partial [Cyanobacteria bacterium]|nr:hypothetical protein [Cyanobacteriota bacterium]
MGVGIYLNGRIQSAAEAEEFLGRVERWFEEISGDDIWSQFTFTLKIGTAYSGEPALFAGIHPAGEDLEFLVPEPGRVVV